MLQTIGKISVSKSKALSWFCLTSFSSSEKGDNSNKFPVNSLDLPEKQPRYRHKLNYNFEEFRKYTRQVKEATKLSEQDEALELKIKSRDPRTLPRRQRRIYTGPKYDYDISNYTAWRVYDRPLPKLHEHSLPVVCKILVSPKHLKKAFGQGKPAFRNSSATVEYDFEDKDLDLFLLYDYKSTTKYWGPNKEGYDYNNQEDIPPRKRIQSYPTEQEFWESEEDQVFRVNCTDYADFRKFKKWITEKVNEAKTNVGESYEEHVLKRFGQPETYNDYDKDYEVLRDPAVFKFSRDYFLEPGEKHEKRTVYHDKIKPAKKLDDKYKIAYDLN